MSGEFWTAGTDKGDVPNAWTWCSSSENFEPKETTWAPGYPNNNGDCVYLKNPLSKDGNISLYNGDCDEEKFFICDTRLYGEVPGSMQMDCMDEWKVTRCKYDF
jgi:hypothetical protein